MYFFLLAATVFITLHDAKRNVYLIEGNLLPFWRIISITTGNHIFSELHGVF